MSTRAILTDWDDMFIPCTLSTGPLVDSVVGGPAQCVQRITLDKHSDWPALMGAPFRDIGIVCEEASRFNGLNLAYMLAYGCLFTVPGVPVPDDLHE